MDTKENSIKVSEKIEETFRDSVGTMDETGTRKWVFPRKPKGKYTNYREYVGYSLIFLFVIMPFLKIRGNPVLLINIIDRKFFIFGQPFYLQDFFILALGAVASVIFVMLFTVVFGRIFCGWICPQTLFMEMIFRKIEYWIEGDRNKQMKLNKQAWDEEKIRKRALKWSVFLLISLLISHIMFMYIVGYEETVRIILSGPAKYPTNFIVMLVFTGIFYFVFAWFREQVCTLVCPYGRLQGVLIDKHTVNVYYDFKRGEGRAKWRNGENRSAVGKGDCIDCQQCVVVCPTGIDIRNGQQLECINCTVCIDACDEVMEKVGMPKGLIRYATEAEIENQEKFKFTARMKATTVALFVLIGVLCGLMYDRGSVEAKFIRPAGSAYFVREGKITNTFTYTILNKSNEKKMMTIKVLYPKHSEITFAGKEGIIVKGDAIIKGNVNISFPESEVKLSKQNIEIGVFDADGEMLDSYKTYFEGPFKFQF